MNKFLALVLIIVIATVLRVYQLGANPTILNRDEAAIAYNALLLKYSGQDEWRQSWPIAFKSFGDYKLPGYIYTLLPFLLIQENEFMVRLPAAIAGILIVLITYKIGLSLFEKKYALLLSLVIALSPFAIFYSRMAWEANLGLMWSLLSFYLLFFHQPGKTKFKLHSDIMAVLAVILAIVTYNTPLIYLPIVILLVILTRVKLSYKEFLPLTIILSGILIFFLIAFNNLNSQKTGIIIFTDPTVWQQYVEYRNSLSSALVPLFGNKYVYWLKIMINNVIKTLSYKFLVSAGGSHPWHQVPGFGHLYSSIYFLGLGGICLSIIDLIKTAKKGIEQILTDKKFSLLLLLGAGLIPSIITTDSPHATRSLLFLVIFTVFSVIALKKINYFIKKETLVIALFSLVLVFQAAIYLHAYFVNYPQQQSILKPGYDQAIMKLNHATNQPVVVQADGYQYIVTAWYLNIRPTDFFETVQRQEPDTAGLYYGRKLMNYEFVSSLDNLPENSIILYWHSQTNSWNYK